MDRLIFSTVIILTISPAGIWCEESSGRTDPAAGKESDYATALIETLVDRSLAIANQENPVGKATFFNDIAQKLADCAALEADRGETEKVNRFARSYSRVVRWGVMGQLQKAAVAREGRTLERITLVHPKKDESRPPEKEDLQTGPVPAPRREAIERVLRNAEKHQSLMQSVLEKVPADERDGIRRAIETSQRAQKKVWETLNEGQPRSSRTAPRRPPGRMR